MLDEMRDVEDFDGLIFGISTPSQKCLTTFDFIREL